MTKDGGNRESKLPIYRREQLRQDRWINSRPKSTTEITRINEGMGHAGIKGAISRKSMSSPHAPYSSKMGEIFPEKTAQKARRHLP